MKKSIDSASLAFNPLKLRNQSYIFAILMFVFLSTISLGAAAQSSSAQSSLRDDEAQEISYDSLLSQLQSRQKKIVKEQHSPYDDVFVHASLGLVSSYSTFNWQNKISSWQQNGINLGLGADLFSRYWYGEGIFRNYGISSSSGQELTLRQYDFRIGFKDEIQFPFKYHLGFGLSTRTLKMTDLYTQASAEENSPAMLLFGRLMAQPNPNVSIGLDFCGRTPFASSGVDRGSLEFGLVTVLSL